MGAFQLSHPFIEPFCSHSMQSLRFSIEHKNFVTPEASKYR